MRLLRTTTFAFAVAFAASGLARAGELRMATSAGVTATLVGEVSASQLAASEANRQALAAQQNAPAVEQPIHRLPNGSLMSAPSRAALEALPLIAEPNADILSADAFGLAFASIKGFVGIKAADNVTAKNGSIEPPDQGLAVNNNIAAEINNNVLRFFNTTTGASLTGPIATPTFFDPAHRLPLGTRFSDPQAFFDPTTGRWFLDEIFFNFRTVEGFAIAVSKTSNPLGSYFLYQVRAFSSALPGCGGIDCLPDYPKAGYDRNIFIIDVNLYNMTSPFQPFVAAAAYVLPKSKLIAGAGFTYIRLTFPIGDDFTVQPSVPAPGEPFVTAANGTEYLMEARKVPDLTNNVRVWAISNTNNIVSSPLSIRGFGIDVRGEPYAFTVPSTEPNVVGPYCKSKGVTSAPSLDSLYPGFLATVQKASGRLYGALPSGAKDGTGFNRNVIAWFALTPSVASNGIVTSAPIFRQGYVIPPNGYSMSFPAFGLNRLGAGTMGFTITNKSAAVVGGFPSAGFIQFTGTSPTGPIVVTGRGQTSDDGFSGCRSPGPGKVGRWGDYAAAVVDPTTGFFYTANEMIPFKTVTPGQAANWGTFITQLH